MKVPVLRNKNNARGSALMVTVLMLFIVIPLLMVLTGILRIQLKSSMREKNIIRAQDLPQDALVDYMRQFAQNQTVDWTDPAQFQRPDAFYSLGFSSMTSNVDVPNHRVTINAEGTFGLGSYTSKRRMRAVLGFRSDTLRFAVITGGFTSSAVGCTYGPTYVEGDVLVTGANNTFNSLLVATGNICLNNTTVINGDLYHGGTLTKWGGGPFTGTVTGTIFPFAFSADWPIGDFNYWVSRANYNSWASPVATFTFMANGTVLIQDGFTGPSGSIFPTVNSAGVIFVVDGAVDIIGSNTLSPIMDPTGKVRGHVTVVASTVTIRNSLVYANGTQQSDISDSFGIIAYNPVQMIMDDPGGSQMLVNATVWPFYFSGVSCKIYPSPFIIASGSGSGILLKWLRCSGTPTQSFNLVGTTYTGINRVCDVWNGNVGHLAICPGTTAGYSGSVNRIQTFDPNLAQYPPPGFPQHCTILSYEEKGM